VPPSPALAAQCEAETAHALADPLAAAAVRIIVPRGAESCAFANELFTHGARIGPNLDVLVHAADVTAALAAPLVAASSGSPPAYAVKHKLVILTFPDGRRAMQLLHLGEYHPGWLTGQLGMGAQMLHLPPADFVELYRLPLWAALAAIPRALVLGEGTPAKTLEWELDAGKGFQKVVKGALRSRGGAAIGALAAAAAAAAPSMAAKEDIRAKRAAAVAAAGGTLSKAASRAWYNALSLEQKNAWLIATREDSGRDGGMGAGVAELKDQLVEVKKQLATAVLPTAKRVELLAQKAALEAELKAAQAKKSADSAAGGAYGPL
jgi:hypothetical protein